MTHTLFEMRTRVITHGPEIIGCRHNWVSRLFRRRGLCRKCQALMDSSVRMLADQIDADCMAAMLSAGDVPAGQRLKGTHGGGNMSKRFLSNIEGS